jgi:hypothetical protein
MSSLKKHDFLSLGIIFIILDIGTSHSHAIEKILKTSVEQNDILWLLNSRRVWGFLGMG